MRIAHVRERHAPAGAPWRLAAAPVRGRPHRTTRHAGSTSRSPGGGLSPPVPSLAHDASLHRQPLTTLDDLLARGLRVEALRRPGRWLRARGDDDDAGVLDGRRPRLRAAGPPAAVDPRLLRLRGARPRRCGSAAAARSPRPGTGCRSSTSATSRRSAGRTTRSGRRPHRTSSTTSSRSRPSIDTPAVDLPPERAEEAIGGYTIFNDWSARDLQRDETAVRLGPAKGKDFASSFGPWLVTPDELADARRGTRLRPGDDRRRSTATETSRGRWSDAQFSFGEMLARASADARLRPGDLIGSGTVGTGCLLEVRDATLGRYLEPGDEVIARASSASARFATPIVARPTRT